MKRYCQTCDCCGMREYELGKYILFSDHSKELAEKDTKIATLEFNLFHADEQIESQKHYYKLMEEHREKLETRCKRLREALNTVLNDEFYFELSAKTDSVIGKALSEGEGK